MSNSGDVVELDLGSPEVREAGFRRPAVLVTAQRILDASPTVVHVVPLASTLRRFESEVILQPDDGNGLDAPSAAQCQHARSVSPARLAGVRGNVGALTLAQIRDAIATLLDIG